MKPAIDEKPSTPTSESPQAGPERERLLADRAALHRHFGSERLVDKFLWSWFHPDTSYRVLDLSAGTGEIPCFISKWCEERRITVRIDAVESDPAKLEIARKQGKSHPNIDWIPVEPLAYESALTYDLVHCSLAPQRLGAEDKVKLLKHCRELSHQFVIIADLERNLSTDLSVWLMTSLLCREPGTRAYGKRCARSACTWSELRELAKAAGWEHFGHARFLLCSQAVWLFERDLGDIHQEAVEVPSVLPCPT